MPTSADFRWFTKQAALLLLILIFGQKVLAAPTAVRISEHRDLQIVTLRTPEGMHRFLLALRQPGDNFYPASQRYRAPLLYIGKNQRRSNSRLAASKLFDKLTLVFTGKNSGRIYTATLNCSRYQDSCRASLRRVARTFTTRCAPPLDPMRHLQKRERSAALLSITSRELSLAIHLDQEFVERLGDDSEAEALSILNAVEVIYLNQLGLHLRIATITRIGSLADRLDSSDAELLLDQYARFIARARTIERANVHHLFTGKDLFLIDAISQEKLDGVVGLAFIGSTCSDPGQSVSLSQLTKAQLGVRTIIAAHEIGHNLNATHPEESGLPSDAAGIMSAIVRSTNTTFSQFSLNEILPYLNSNGQCLKPSAPQIEIDQVERISNELQLSISTSSDEAASCRMTLYASTRKRMLNAEIKINRVLQIAQQYVTTPSSSTLSIKLKGKLARADRIYLRTLIECPNSSGISRLAETSRSK